ncbi:TIGR03862 family flavoprotein [Sulfitobacter sp. M57]|uniref:TIGR03862 family flavoprotein n=1 Tax=unclassified Sulfitobacter TaxID=196795 RepID=UPI0023E222BE|nr:MULTISPECIES: TIGR03862 family flavoprotein [unclassified Sulfitobacter]MDF3415330.1 TIGR03862 family flavoprotein [Sulfitobacter sp. KE5]MDF3422811.1 TIGR03862 family flavoprotein [Sulfitobacter sp. KE43]MDF3433876.1 TIGR03862 family flavoprotein [Sulfitobacter sp. KE42]MDF3459516.1 TIGR03862 family flavoprotein [Sulfitobacter sp. S74]MDF3463415.1 TIGR03862 family flavoprotein [Sulfitobacter sp. Ks18]
MKHAVVIGAGPAGLMAAEVMAQAGLRVTICEGKPSVGRKFLMAGKSGLNLTKDEAPVPFMEVFAEARSPLSPMIESFGSEAVQDWARGLGQAVFTGTTGRVFPKAMKASPLLRAWMGRLGDLGVRVNTRWLWQGWNGDALSFQTPEGVQELAADVTVLALGGASWSRLGATGSWAETLAAKEVALAPFAGSNAGVQVAWSEHMTKHLGTPLKGVAWQAGPYHSRGEATLSAQGLEGGGIYSVSRGVREGHALFLDLLPDMTVPQITSKLQAPRGKASLSNHLRKTLRLTPAQIALVQEMSRPLPDKLRATARLLKALPIKNAGLRPMDEAISTAGGIRFAAMDEGLMLRGLPGVFAAGEMLDWEAPTGGYLITACLATGRWAGQHAAEWALSAG